MRPDHYGNEFLVERHRKHRPVKKQLALPAPKAEVTVTRETERRVKKYVALAEDVKKVGSVFGVRKREIMAAVEEGNIDHAVLQFQRQAYSTIVNLIPIAEKAYKKHQREHQAYVLNALISQGRELAADLMASDNRKQLGQNIIGEILEPAFKQILQQMLQEQMQLKAILSDKLKSEHVSTAAREMDESLKRVAGAMNEIFKSTSDQVNKKLLGE